MCISPPLTRLGKFFHHDGMYARQWSLPLCVLCGFKSKQGPFLSSLSAFTPCCKVFNSTTSMSMRQCMLSLRLYTYALIKKKIKFSSYIRKFRVEQLQSHICMWKGILIYEEMRKYFPYMRRPFVIYDCSVLNFLVYEENLIFFFVSAGCAIRLICSSYSSINCS